MRQPRVRPNYLALATVLASISAACGGESPLAPNHGRLRIVLAAADSPLLTATSREGGVWPDSAVASWPDTAIVEPGYPDYRPVPTFRSAKLTFSSILARTVDGQLIHVGMALPVTVDASLLEAGHRIELPEGELPVGTYDEVVFVVREVQVVLWDDTRITIEPAGGGWTANVPLCPRVDVEEGGTSTVSLELQVWNGFFWYGERLHFEPQPSFHWPGSCWEDVSPPPTPWSP